MKLSRTFCRPRQDEKEEDTVGGNSKSHFVQTLPKQQHKFFKKAQKTTYVPDKKVKNYPHKFQVLTEYIHFRNNLPILKAENTPKSRAFEENNQLP